MFLTVRHGYRAWFFQETPAAFADVVSRPEWGAIGDVLPLPLDLFFFGVNLDYLNFFGSIFDTCLLITVINKVVLKCNCCRTDTPQIRINLLHTPYIRHVYASYATHTSHVRSTYAATHCTYDSEITY